MFSQGVLCRLLYFAVLKARASLLSQRSIHSGSERWQQRQRSTRVNLQE